MKRRPKPMGHNEGRSKRQVHSTKCLHLKSWRYINISTACLKALEQKEEITPKRSRAKEIINFMT